MSEPKHILPLDGLRGLAAILVTLNHCLSVPETSPVTSFISQVCKTGWIGVDLFFVLSGFLITGILLDTRDRPHFFKNFYMRRSLRIFPLYYATLVMFLIVAPVVLLIVAPHSRFADRIAELRADQWWYWSYMENWLFVKLDAWPTAGHFSHFWSLAIEEQFYLVWPMIIWLCPRKALPGVCVAGCVVGPASRWLYLESGTSWIPAYVATNARVDLLCIGALIALASRSAFRPVLGNWVAWGTAALLGAAGLGMLHAKYNMLETSQTSLLWLRHCLNGGVFGALLIAGISAPVGSKWYRLLTWQPLVWCGVYSYGLYVYHWPICQGLRKLSFEWCPPALRGWVFFAACMVPTCIVAMISMAVLERPFLRLKRRWSYDSDRTVPRPAPDPSPALAVAEQPTA